MKCKKCQRQYRDKFIEFHHLYPKHLGGTDADGRIYLCKKCHHNIGEIIDHSGFIDKEAILKLTNDWLSGKLISKDEEIFPYCPKCKNPETRMWIYNISKIDVTLKCVFCGYEEKNKELLQYQLKKIKKENSMENQKKFKDFQKDINKGDKDDSFY